MSARLLAFLVLPACAPGVELGEATLEPAGLLGLDGASARCEVANRSGTPAPVAVTFTVRLPDGTSSTATESAVLGPKEVKTMEHRFAGVGPSFREQATVSCAEARW